MSEQERSERPHRPLRRRNIVDASRGRFGPTMTPMVDVVLVILIFFMASTTIAGQEWFLRASLPEPHENLPREQGSRFVLPAPMVRIEVFSRNGAVLVNGLLDKELLIEQAVTVISDLDKSTSEDLVLLIVGADDVSFEDIMRLHDAASAIGMRVAIE
ncbi:MAG: biopolymer transporter ExbD [Phycisphaerales bacterium]|nr:biopolymer transporter ExbD [Phycisphaerales bacterium]